MIDYFLPVSITLGLITWGLVARWYILPWMNGQTLGDALTPLLLMNVLRYVGLAFLIPGVTDQVLDDRFAAPAAWGDLAAALLALLALVALHRNWKTAGTVVWIFNVFGAADLINAVLQGLRYTVDGHLGATYFIPALFVPILFVAHVVIGVVQLQHRTRQRPVDELSPTN